MADTPVGRSATLDDSLQRAHRLAVAQAHGAVTLEHLLFALSEDPDAVGLLVASRTHLDRLRADVSGYLGRLSEMMPAAPGQAPVPGPDLLRILQLAGLAARQSQRRQIDSAIVLAAIIGDGNSPAAGMLKAQGLTFEEVIRVLQQGTPPAVTSAPAPSQLPPPPAPSQPAPPQPAPPQPVPPQRPAPQPSSAPMGAEAYLANARARVKQAEPTIMPTRPVTEARSEPPAIVEPLQPTPAAAPPPPAPEPVQATPPPPLPQAAPPPPIPPPAEAPPADALSTYRLSPTPAGTPPPLPPQLPPPVAAQPPPTLPPPRPSPVAAPPPPPAAPPPVRAAAAPPPLPLPYAPLTPPSHTPAGPALLPSQGVAPPGAMPALVPRDPLGIVAAASGLPAVVRVGEPVLVEVRVPRGEVDVPRATARPGIAPISEPPVYRVVTARLTANSTAIVIEPRTPETLWLEPSLGHVADDVTWQFLVTPQRRGTIPVSLTISGRTISAYGVMADKSEPSETFAVTVKRAPGSLAKRFFKGVLLLAIGAGSAWAVLGPLAAPIRRLWAAALG